MESPLAHKADSALVVVVVGVENQSLQGRVIVALGRRHKLDDGFQHIPAVEAGLGGNHGRFGSVQTDHILDFLLHFLGAGGDQVDLVDDGHGFQIVLQRHIHIGQRLGLDALGGIHHQQRALAGRQRTADLIAEVHMAGGVDQVQGVGLAVLGLVLHAHRLGLDGDAALPFQFHGVQNLIHHLPLLENACHFQQAVGKGALAVVDVGDDAKVTNMGKAFVAHQRRPLLALWIHPSS